MNEITVGLLAVGFLLILFLSGMELWLSMALVGFVGFGYLKSFNAAFNLLAKDFFDVFSTYGFTVMPLFIFMGQIAFNSGVAKKLYDSAHRFVGHVPGGLALATVLGATIFKAICGSSPATAATFASVAVPEMDRFGYHRKLSTGVVASVSTLGVLIPPSVALIVIGIITQQSIGKLFLAGLIPGLIIACLFLVVIVGWCHFKPELGPKSEKYTWGEWIKTIPDVVGPVVTFFVIITGLLAGFFTPTEAGSVGTFAVIILCLVQRSLTFRAFIKSVSESLRAACMVLAMIAGSTVLGHFLTVTQIPAVTANWVVSLDVNRHLIMLFILIIYLLGGSFLDDVAFMILATPIFFPATIKLGFDPIWFGILIAVTLGIGVIIPPVAINVFIVKNITKESLNVIYSGVYPFLVGLIGCGILLFCFPQLVTFLPRILMK